MKNIGFVFLSIVLFSFTYPLGLWKEFKNFEGKFRVLTPTGVMTEKISKMKTAMGDLEYHQFIYRPEEKTAENVFYLVNYCDYPKGTFPKDSTELINDFFTETVESSAKSVSGEVTYQADIQQITYKGKVWRVQYNQNRVIVKNKCYLAGDRFYLLQVMTLKDKNLNPAIDKFLDSFQIF